MPTEFLIDATALPEPMPALTKKLAGRVERSHTERSVWLDTHDWLIHQAGYLLEQQIGPRGPWLVLTELDGTPVAKQPTSRATVTAKTLPEGPIGDRVRGLIGIRALLPQVAAGGPVETLAVVDDLDKTVARVVVEGPLDVDGGDPVPMRARVDALRGYEKEARQTAKRLRSIKGVEPTGPRFAAVAGAGGVDPTAHRAKPDLRFSPAMPAGDAFADAFGQLLAILRDNVEGTLAQLDTEFLHDLRVTVRRGRAVLRAGSGVVDEPVAATYARELKWLGDQTSRSRDLDVYLLGYDDLAARVSDPAALDPFRQRLVRQCRSAHAALNKALRSDRFVDLLAGWERDLATAHHGELAGTPVAEVANQRLAKAWRRVLKRGRAITDASPPDALHDLRKRCKELRYLLELFASLHDPATHKGLVRELKRLQDNLGAFQDFEAQRFLVLDHAEALATRRVPAATLMSLGRLEHQLEEGQGTARAEFAACWSRFDRKENQRLYEGLVG